MCPRVGGPVWKPTGPDLSLSLTVIVLLEAADRYQFSVMGMKSLAGLPSSRAMV